jgi:NAD(P)-dependent dehydrogenase (short-subunit alcohol dehydrogenase family)
MDRSDTAAAAARPPSLAGRVVAIVGATGGLGRETAMACGRAGATVVLIGRRVRALETVYDALVAAGAPEPAIRPLDLATAGPAECAETAAAIEVGLGRLDAVVFAAADFEHLARTPTTDPGVWLRQIHVNLSANWLLFRAFEPLLARAPSADVVFVLEDPVRMRRAYWGGYGVAKVGLEGLVATLADEYGRTTIRIHGFQPGPMATALRGRAFVGESGGSPSLPDHAAAAIAGILAAPARASEAAEGCVRGSPDDSKMSSEPC